jgi:hypothetical protein
MMEIGGMEQPGRVPPHQIYAVDTETVFEANYIDPESETLSGVEYETCLTVEVRDLKEPSISIFAPS